MPSLIDLSGQKKGRWTIVRQVSRNKHRRILWMCRCDCGTKKIVDGQALRSGASRSCGCLNKDVHQSMCIERNITHGMTKTTVYTRWSNMRSRCSNPSSGSYHKYGAKGIKVCQRWDKFENFLKDMGEPPTDKHTIDRIDPHGDYTPNNCRWATMKAQQNNRTNNRLITFKGRTQTLMQWSEETGIHRKTISRRIDMGWSLSDALTIKGKKGRNQYSGKNLVDYNGKKMTINEWAKHLNINSHTLRDRLRRLHWSVEKALTTKAG